MTYSIIIPIYSVNDHLDICLLSILGQVQLPQVQVVAVPLTHLDAPATQRLAAWQKRDPRITIPNTTPAPTLYDAFRVGIASANGDYLMFMNQTDLISSPQDLSAALTTAQQQQVQVLLTAKQQLTDTDAYSPSLPITPRHDLLPLLIPVSNGSAATLNSLLTTVSSGSAATINSLLTTVSSGSAANLFLLTPPLVYGNIYQREYMADLFQFPHVFANAADLAVSQIALLHAKRVSYTDIPTMRTRYEASPFPLLTPQELSLTQETLIRQITVKLATNHAETIVHNITLLYISYLLSSYHPFSAFARAAAHYRPLCKQLTDPINCNIHASLFGCLKYLSTIVRSNPNTPADTPNTPNTPADTLIEAYTFPSRTPLFTPTNPS